MKTLKKSLILSCLILLSACNNVEQGTMEMMDGHTHNQAESEDHHHDKAIEVQPENPPTLSLEVSKDDVSGFNLHLITSNFRFAPEHASQNHLEGEGHAHVYVDDIKKGRIYGNWYHLDNLQPGEHTIRVNLNANDHSPFTIKGKEISDSKTVVVTE